MAKKSKKKRKIIIVYLYEEDFNKSHIWDEICEIVGVRPEADQCLELEIKNVDVLRYMNVK